MKKLVAVVALSSLMPATDSIAKVARTTLGQLTAQADLMAIGRVVALHKPGGRRVAEVEVIRVVKGDSRVSRLFVHAQPTRTCDITEAHKDETALFFLVAGGDLKASRGFSKRDREAPTHRRPGLVDNDSTSATMQAALGVRPEERTMTRQFTFDGRLRSVSLACRGAWLMLRSQHNAWIHAVATVAVVGAALFFRVTPVEWCCLILATMAVWTAEALNTALELLADAATPDFHPLVGKAKDVAAGAVLISAIGAVVIGILLLGPSVLTALGQSAR
jgi:diacylglycerol kinase (ATP)